jgi:hypothetical protein
MMAKVSASMLVVTLCGAPALPSGCAKAVKTDTRPAEEDPLRQECELLLGVLEDCGTEESMLKVMGEFDLLGSKHGRETLANALKSIARQHRFLGPTACSVLSRYVSVEEHAGFVLDLKKEDIR